MATESSRSSKPEAEAESKSRRESKDWTDEPVLSPEGVPYQSSGFPASDENPGPFDSGEGKHSDHLKANVEAAEAQAKAQEATAKETPPR